MYTHYGKRLFDIIGALVLLVIAVVPMFIVAVLVKTTSKGPILFRQPRAGLGGKTFTMVKFRSMASDNDVHDATKADYVTPVGKILRLTSLDELPQLINIVKGEMSFIGPRPWITEYYKHMSAQQRRRNNVRPGITGLAQAHGRNNLSIHQKIAYDLEYVDNISFREDIKVIFVTIQTLFDHEAHELGKGGIHYELDELRKQGAKIQ